MAAGAHQQTVGQDRGDLDDRHVEVAVEAEPHELGIRFDADDLSGFDEVAVAG